MYSICGLTVHRGAEGSRTLNSRCDSIRFDINGCQAIIKVINMGDDGMDYNIVFPEPHISGKVQKYTVFTALAWKLILVNDY